MLCAIGTGALAEEERTQTAGSGDDRDDQLQTCRSTARESPRVYSIPIRPKHNYGSTIRFTALEAAGVGFEPTSDLDDHCRFSRPAGFGSTEPSREGLRPRPRPPRPSRSKPNLPSSTSATWAEAAAPTKSMSPDDQSSGRHTVTALPPTTVMPSPASSSACWITALALKSVREPHAGHRVSLPPHPRFNVTPPSIALVASASGRRLVLGCRAPGPARAGRNNTGRCPR